MGIVIPVSKISDEEYVEKINTIISAAMEKARTKYLSDKGELTYRDIQPEDLGLSDWSESLNAGDNTIVNLTVPDDAMIVIWGVANKATNPVTRALKFETGASTVDWVDISKLYATEVPEGMFDDVKVATPSSTFKIIATAKAAGTDEIQFLGVVIEPKGKNISG